MIRRALALLALIFAGIAVAALPSSGAITLANLQTEFGGSNPVSITEYYRGGGLVPNTAPNAAIPTSGQISLSNFYGTGGGSVYLDCGGGPCSALSYANTPTASTILVTFWPNGFVDTTTGDGMPPILTFPGQWYGPGLLPGIGASFWLRVTPTVGTFTSNGASSCVSLSSNRTISKSRTGAGSAFVTFTVDFYSDSGCTANVYSLAGNNLNAEVF